MIMSTKDKSNNDIWELKNEEWEENIKYVKETLTPRRLAYFVPILDTGREQCKSVIELNSEYYSTPYFGNIKTDLLTFSIMRLFDKKYLPINFPYVVEPTIINKRNRYVAPILKIGNIDINILKAYKRNRIDDNDRKYLKKRCKGNEVLRGQLDLFDDNSENSHLHGVVTYNISRNWDKYNFIDLTFFGPNLREVIVKVDLLKTLHIYGGDNNIDTKQSLVDDENLRQEIQNELNKMIRNK